MLPDLTYTGDNFSAHLTTLKSGISLYPCEAPLTRCDQAAICKQAMQGRSSLLATSTSFASLQIPALCQPCNSQNGKKPQLHMHRGLLLLAVPKQVNRSFRNKDVLFSNVMACLHSNIAWGDVPCFLSLSCNIALIAHCVYLVRGMSCFAHLPILSFQHYLYMHGRDRRQHSSCQCARCARCNTAFSCSQYGHGSTCSAWSAAHISQCH